MTSSDPNVVGPPGPPRSPYDGAADRWDRGAVLVYGPLAVALVDRSPHSLVGHRVLDVGAGTGVGSRALHSAGARPVALDLSHDMLAWRQGTRPPSVVASVLDVPVCDGGVDDVFASFVLNHVADPVLAVRELARTGRTGGALLAHISQFLNGLSARAQADLHAAAIEAVTPVMTPYRPIVVFLCALMR